MTYRHKVKNRIRKSTKYMCIFISIVILIFSLGSLCNNLLGSNQSTVTKEIYNYKDRFRYDYKVNLENNKYMTQEDVEDKTLAYVTDLIDNIDLDLNYEYSGSKQSDLEYTYHIDGKMQVFYSKNGEEQKIWEKSENILEEKDGKKTGDTIKIKESIVLDLKDKNALINDFKQQLGMSIDARYIVSLSINVKTNIEDQDVNDNYSADVKVNLAEKTTKILGDNNTERVEYISKKYNIEEEQKNIIIVFDIVISIIAIGVMVKISRTKTVNPIKNKYKYELNKILKVCQDKIVEVSTKPKDSGQEIVYVKDFGEVVKISEELFKPILYYNQKENEEAWFSVVSGKTSYRYVLKK